MKLKKMSILILLGCASYVCAQYSGNVGINTSTPTATLNVKGKGNTTVTQALRVENSDGVDLLTINDNGTVSGSAISNLGSSFSFSNLNSNTTISTGNQVVNINGNFTLTLPATPANGQLVYIISPANNGGINGNGKQITLQDGSQIPSFSYASYPGYRITLLIYNGTAWYNPF